MSEPTHHDFDLPLGLIPIPEDTVEQDWKVNEGYISYSAELLRLSLLAITGIATLCLKLSKDGQISREVCKFSPGLICLGISTASAVAHRYLAVDSMYYHIQSIRLSIRDRPKDHPSNSGNNAKSDADRRIDVLRRRAFRFGVATWLLRSAAVFLVLGILLSALGLFGR